MPPSLFTGSGLNKLQRVCILLLLGGTILYFSGTWRRGYEQTPSRDAMSEASRSMCELYPDTGDIAVIIKTGAQEGLQNLPTTLRTSLSCVQNFSVLSDLNQTLGDIQIHDVLSRFSRPAMKGNKEFDIYWKQQRLQADGKESEIPSLSSIPAIERDWRTKGRTAGWALDKYKWLHMLDMAWDLQPDRDWYLFVETDTYVSWPNLKRWLQTLESKQKYYLGLAVKKSDDREPLYFAQGGSGIVLSGALLREFAVERRGIASKYERRMREWWAGDFTLADVLYDELGIHVTQILPMVNQHPPRSIPLSPIAWCQAALAMHHMKADDFDEMFKREHELGFSRLLLRDVYDKIYPDGLPSESVDWNNIADAHEWAVPIDRNKLPLSVDPNSDFNSCRIACEAHEDCFSFTWRNTTINLDGPDYNYLHSCVLSGAFRLGAPKPEQAFWSNTDERDTYRRWHSGWMRYRISEWAKAHWECDPSQEWATHAIES
ncbi:uncharacterized protein LTR77_004625 [Saxophila tyrrhenica]|uniref:N-acetylgalactosaminide beta-1,3-galactosyltransferase n=1 Tax=Saxophila tyrrhenica TaxID=1690608 RepID=A0AAV9PDZ8_9PEZI|nr:hypothetical protein LTR77_004625 [Saxophila tyrrhenica]